MAAAGRNLAQLPVDAKVGKLLVLAASLGCLSPALTIAACLSYKSPFSAPFEQQDAALRAKQGFAAAGASHSSQPAQLPKQLLRMLLPVPAMTPFLSGNLILSKRCEQHSALLTLRQQWSC